MGEIFSVENVIAFLSLTLIEIVLGIDNIVFAAIVAQKLPGERGDRARRWGIGLAMFTRILLLLFITWLMLLTQPLFSLLEHGISGRDLILFSGGLFLIGKATLEIHQHTEDNHGDPSANLPKKATFGAVILQIAIIDIIFSLDSVITAVGMAQDLRIMIAAVVVAVGVMMFCSGTISHFIQKHPTLKVLALSFLLLVGVLLVAESLGKHIDRGYIYFAMAFSLMVETINIRAGRGHKQTT